MSHDPDGAYEFDPRSEEEKCDLEWVHVADNTFGTVHKGEDLVILDLYTKGITLQFSNDEWIEFKQLMWEAIKNDKR